VPAVVGIAENPRGKPHALDALKENLCATAFNEIAIGHDQWPKQTKPCKNVGQFRGRPGPDPHHAR